MDDIKSAFKKAQEKIKFLEQVIAKMPGLVYCKDIHGAYLGSNEAQAKIVGLSTHADIIGKTDFDILPKEEAEKLRAVDTQIMSGELIIDEAHPIEEEIQLQNGIVTTFESVKIPIYDSNDGTVMGLVGLSRDVTKEKQAELARKAFLRNMEHDLRTPFIGIGGSAAMIQALFVPLYPEIAEWIDPLVTSATEWENIHHSIFDVVGAGKKPVVLENFSIQSVLQKIADIMAATLHLKNLTLTIHSTTASQEDMIYTDRFKFHVILLALIGNAIKFTNEGKIDVMIHIKEACYIIDVIDTGIGIPSDKLDYIFEEFTKLIPSNQNGNEFKGLGAGLYISQLEAKAVGAKITVTSELGKGSIFTLTIPNIFPIIEN